MPGSLAVYSVDMADQWVVCGAASELVRVWDFTRAQEGAERAAASKALRRSKRAGGQRGRERRGNVAADGDMEADE